MDIEQAKGVTEAGTIVMLSAGCYSAYEVQGLLRLLRPVDLKAELKRYAQEARSAAKFKDHWYYENEPLDGFERSLVEQGIGERVACHEFHLYEYEHDLKSVIEPQE